MLLTNLRALHPTALLVALSALFALAAACTDGASGSSPALDAAGDGDSGSDVSDAGGDASGSDANGADASADASGDVGDDAGEVTDGPYAGYVSAVYADTAAWLCHPGLESSICTADLSVTEVAADGSASVVPHVAAEDPAVDCFYVYPTASSDSAGNSDMLPGAEETFITQTQVGPLNAVCRVFAPIYTQVTLTALLGMTGEEPDWNVAFAGVLDAWKHYIANENQGRGVILVGHSQGTFHLRTLIAREVEADDRLHQRLVAAYLIGGSVEVPVGEDVGGSFARTPVCRERDQTGCVVSYASYRADAPPPIDSLFGRASPGMTAVCNHPAALDGGRAPIRARLPIRVPGLFAVATGGNLSPYETPGAHDPIETLFFSLPGMLEAECATELGASYLAIDLAVEPGDPRVDKLSGELSPQWGLHLIDIFLTSDDLIDLARSQIAAFVGR